VAVSQFSLIEGDDLDVGVRLEDCGGWIVSEWHDHAVVTPPPAAADVRSLAIEGADRMRAWSDRDRAHSAVLFARGVSSAPGDPPTYFFSLFKTVDGNMRAYVRGGGPAYVAGLRSGDVVSKIDGKFWWEYGTFQTQLRAYDGKPHSLEVLRGSQTIDVQLGAPFVPST
jgi:S1-C subfamily serine protease